MAWLQNGIDKSRDGYVRLVTPIARRTFLALILVGGFVLATGGIGSLVPSGFLPDEDQGAFMAEVQLPDAASTNRTAGRRSRRSRRRSTASPGCRASSPSPATACSTA